MREVIADPSRPVVMFALEWCEFCWSVRRMLSRFGIAFRSIDLDSVEYQAGDRGGAIRRRPDRDDGREYLAADIHRRRARRRRHGPDGGLAPGTRPDAARAARRRLRPGAPPRTRSDVSAGMAAAAIGRLSAGARVSRRYGRSRIRRRRTARRRRPDRRAATGRAGRHRKSAPRRATLRLRRRS